MESPMEYDLYRNYWFGTFAVIAVVDEEDQSQSQDGLREGRNWEECCLGTFYVKPNYPGEFFFSFFFFNWKRGGEGEEE